MKKRKIPKVSKRRLVVFGTLSLFIILSSIFTTIYYSVNIMKVKKQNEALETELKRLQNEEENLKIEILKLKDPEYVARFARENYSYSKDGEYIIQYDKKENKQKLENVDDYNYVYIIVVSVCVLVVVLLFINKKKKTVE